MGGSPERALLCTLTYSAARAWNSERVCESLFTFCAWTTRHPIRMPQSRRAATMQPLPRIFLDIRANWLLLHFLLDHLLHDDLHGVFHRIPDHAVDLVGV